MTLAAARVTLPQLSLQSFRALAKLVGSDQVSKVSWATGDLLKEKPPAPFKAPPTESRLKHAERMYAPEEWHTIAHDAAERNPDRHLASDLREEAPADFDELMDLALETDFADAGSVRAGMGVLPSSSRSRLHIPAEHGVRSSSSCPAWADPKKAYSTNRGPRSGATAKSNASDKPSNSNGAGGDSHHL